MVSTDVYWHAVFGPAPTRGPRSLPARGPVPPLLPGFGIAIGAVVLAAVVLRPARLGHPGEIAERALARIMAPIHALHSGRVGDYVAWFVFGIAAYGGYLLLATRA